MGIGTFHNGFKRIAVHALVRLQLETLQKSRNFVCGQQIGQPLAAYHILSAVAQNFFRAGIKLPDHTPYIRGKNENILT